MDGESAQAMSEQSSEGPPKQPPETPEHGPKGPRTPYPVDEPADPNGPGSEPDYFPGRPGGDLPKLRQTSRPGRLNLGYPRILITWQQAH